MVRYSVKVNGIVQGVGFRPFVYRTAKMLSLRGFVMNTSEGVSIEIEGIETNCGEFIEELKCNPPVMAMINDITVLSVPLAGDEGFKIIDSEIGSRNTLISPDLGICDACARDISHKGNRRFGYAYTNCTDCGPRFSIIRDIPYDRVNTTMSEFKMCDDCAGEYSDPEDRRFHAQPNACPVCGPELIFLKDGMKADGDPVRLFNELIRNGGIAALKGIGGYHLVCDACNPGAVERLRKNKLRYDKPFAVMVKDAETVKKYCVIGEKEKELLNSREKPIVLLEKNKDCPAAEQTAPGNKRLGIILPYTPLHCIIMKENEALIMTSGNISDHPMIFEDNEAVKRLTGITDAILTGNRPIYRRVDDSVCFAVSGKTHMIRRARGYVPQPLCLKSNKKTILAAGAQQKNTFCLAKGENAFISGHIGDLDEEDTQEFYKKEIQNFIKLFEANPEAIVCDMHPDYASTRYAEKIAEDLPLIKIQHHQAHFASVLAENHIQKEAIGFIFDGTGYGTDGCIWGGEALVGNVAGNIRSGRLRYFPLLGGEAAIREPWRAALAVADAAVGRTEALSLFDKYSRDAEMLLNAGDKKINAPLTSSMGRLFDAAAALTGIRSLNSYEGQAAVDFRNVLNENSDGAYEFGISEENGLLIFDWRPVIADIIIDIKKGIYAETVSARFHRSVSALIIKAAGILKNKTGLNCAALSGGVFQNDWLLKNAMIGLEKRGFEIYTNERIPANDGGISFGQAAAASADMR